MGFLRNPRSSNFESTFVLQVSRAQKTGHLLSCDDPVKFTWYEERPGNMAHESNCMGIPSAVS